MMLEELRGRFPGKGAQKAKKRTPARRWLLPVLIAVPVVLVLLRFRPAVTRAVAVLADRLDRADLSLPPSSPTVATSTPAEAVHTGLPTSEVAGSVEVAERVAARPVVDEDVDVIPDGAPAADSGVDSVPGDGTLDCPAGFPIKGNTTSKIYHLPGTSYYDKTRPGVCFRTTAAAEGAGYRASKASPVRAASAEDDS